MRKRPSCLFRYSLDLLNLFLKTCTLSSWWKPEIGVKSSLGPGISLVVQMTSRNFSRYLGSVLFSLHSTWHSLGAGTSLFLEGNIYFLQLMMWNFPTCLFLEKHLIGRQTKLQDSLRALPSSVLPRASELPVFVFWLPRRDGIAVGEWVRNKLWGRFLNWLIFFKWV